MYDRLSFFGIRMITPPMTARTAAIFVLPIICSNLLCPVMRILQHHYLDPPPPIH